MPGQNRVAAPHVLPALQDRLAETFQGKEAAQELHCAGVRQQAPRDDEKFKLLPNSLEGADAPLLYNLRQPHLHGVHR